MNRVAGKRAVVVGAGGHLGAAISLRLFEEGAVVHLVDSDRSALDHVSADLGSSDRAVVHAVETRSMESMRHLFDGIEGEHGRVDILVAASWRHSFAPVDELTEEIWQADIETNLSIGYRAVHAVVRHMKPRGTGRIVTISSTAKDGVPWFAALGHSSHAAARGGMAGFTRALSYELGCHGIAVNCVVVGPLDNPKARRVFDSLRDDDTVRVKPEDMIALGTLGSPRDVAQAVLFLASDEASYITGESLYVSGGLYG